jgi:hypothetical protein
VRRRRGVQGVLVKMAGATIANLGVNTQKLSFLEEASKVRGAEAQGEGVLVWTGHAGVEVVRVCAVEGAACGRGKGMARDTCSRTPSAFRSFGNGNGGSGWQG